MKRKAREVMEEITKKVSKQSAKKVECATVASTKSKPGTDPKKDAAAFVQRTPTVPSVHNLQSDDHLCNVLSWNVAGLRGTLKNNKTVFDTLVEAYNPLIICIQETKIQQEHEVDFDSDDEFLPGYIKFWCSSVTKKGYSGTAMFVKKSICGQVSSAPPIPKTSAKQSTISSFFSPHVKKPKCSDGTIENKVLTTPSELESLPLELKGVSFELDDARFTGEGRTITAEFNNFFLVNCYVPNSGQTLDRLGYRTSEWDPYLYNYLKKLEEKKPLIFTGDLNVAHLDLDIHNPTAKHLIKQAGVTPQERKSFSSLLSTGFQDAFRFFYPDHEGQFTYWSQRTNARVVNKGLRLDYFMCSKSLFPTFQEDTIEQVPLEIIDSSILFRDTVGCSDHCPILLTFRLRHC